MSGAGLATGVVGDWTFVSGRVDDDGFGWLSAWGGLDDDGLRNVRTNFLLTTSPKPVCGL